MKRTVLLKKNKNLVKYRFENHFIGPSK